MDHNKTGLVINNISKRIKKRVIVEPLTHSLNTGNIIALCGGNGAGKSTLIRLITGLISPTSGEVYLNGISKKQNKKKFLNEIGYMPDDFQFQKSITAKETLLFYAKLKGIGSKRVEDIFKQVGLLEDQNKKVSTFSKGMNQRLLLAQALLANPNFLILDEPTNGLDPYWVKQFSKLMLSAKKNGQTIIFSTHDLHVAEEIADEVLFLKNGNVIDKGPIHNYKTVGLHETFQNLYFEKPLL